MTGVETVVLKSSWWVWEMTDSESVDNEGLLYSMRYFALNILFFLMCETWAAIILSPFMQMSPLHLMKISQAAWKGVTSARHLCVQEE
jgi:hypothetical protein